MRPTTQSSLLIRQPFLRQYSVPSFDIVHLVACCVSLDNSQEHHWCASHHDPRTTIKEESCSLRKRCRNFWCSDQKDKKQSIWKNMTVFRFSTTRTELVTVVKIVTIGIRRTVGTSNETSAKEARISTWSFSRSQTPRSLRRRSRGNTTSQGGTAIAITS